MRSDPLFRLCQNRPRMRHARLKSVLQAACFLCLAGGFAAPAQTAPADYEEIVSAKLAEAQGGEVLRLSAGTQEFLALYKTASSTDTGRAALILHGMSGHADWPDVVAPLRRGLPAQGWATLSIQLPVLAPGAPWADYGATLPRVPARIDSAMTCLSRLGYRELAIIGYGFGATAAARYLAANGKGLSAFVGISMHAPPFLVPRPDLLESLRHVPIPMLDIYGGRDHADILREADDRRLAGMQERARSYEQSAIEGADHDYAGYEAVLISRIVGWLDRSAKPVDPGALPVRAGNEGASACRTGTN